MTHLTPTRVFVYGTLRPGERNARVARRGGPFVTSPASLRGYRLLHLLPEAYPLLVPGEPWQTVRGDLLTYRPDDWTRALSLLDALEGLHESPPLYTREQVTVTPGGGEPVSAWVYVYARGERLTRPGVQLVPGGDWQAVFGQGAHADREVGLSPGDAHVPRWEP